MLVSRVGRRGDRLRVSNQSQCFVNKEVNVARDSTAPKRGLTIAQASIWGARLEMKFIVIAAACLFTSGAAAAEPSYLPLSNTAAAFDWTGFYFGANLGYGGGAFEHPFEITDGVDSIAGTLDVTAGGFVGGVQAGYNYQVNSFVLGIEGDIQGSMIDGQVSASVSLFGSDTLSLEAGTHLDWFATVRARAGYAYDRFVAYVTGGPALGRTTSSIFANVGPTTLFNESVTLDRLGFAAGAGLEYALTDNLTFKTEYLYTDFGTANLLTEDLGGGLTATLDSIAAFHTVRAGMNFHF